MLLKYTLYAQENFNVTVLCNSLTFSDTIENAYGSILQNVIEIL